MRLLAGGATDRGRVREGNEDGYLLEPRLRLFAVADGMGGHRGGEVASATALETLRSHLRAGGGDLLDAVRRANRAVLERAATDTALTGMGTTLTAALGTDEGVTLAHVGDSRAYLLRAGVLRRLTTDHSLVGELVREGRITEAEATMHPYRSVVTRALGVDDALEVDIVPVPLEPGDRVLLCSDGLTSMLPDTTIAEVLAAEADPTRAANRLVDLANEAGGEDNITVVVIDAGDDPIGLPAGVAHHDAEQLAPPVTTTPPATQGPGPDAGHPGAPAGVGPSRRARRLPRPVGLALRGVWVAIPVVLVVGIAFAATAYYARRTYFVGFDAAERVTIYQGRPGGLLWWGQTVRERTGTRRDDLTEAAALAVERTPSFARLGDAVAFVGRLDRRRDATRGAGPAGDATTPSTDPAGTPPSVPSVPSVTGPSVTSGRPAP